MSQKGKPKRTYTDEFKIKQVARLMTDKKRDPSLTIKWRAEKLDLAPNVLRNWVKDSRYGGDLTLFSNRKKTLTGLPTNSKPTGPMRARPLIATRFECPHCGGAVTRGTQ